METFTGTFTDGLVLLMFGGLIYKAVEMLNNALNDKWAAVRTQAVVWLAGVGLMFILSYSELGSQIRLGTGYLYGMNTASRILLGTALASTMSIIHDQVSNRGSRNPERERSDTVPG